ncbi:MAG: nuclear transport factor 2 family protein [Bacteroidota bacterium]|nr:nuclear transport factor 2 family protein [Bacteroidota bacterium]
MKTVVTLLFCIATLGAMAQSKDEKILIEKTYLLSHTVFGSKDSLTLEKLFAKTATYGHSHGNLQTRKQAIDGASHNQSTYSDTAVSNIKILIEDRTAIVRYLFKANENKKDGTVIPLNFSMMLVWIKENGDWKLMGRQAVSVK